MIKTGATASGPQSKFSAVCRFTKKKNPQWLISSLPAPTTAPHVPEELSLNV